MSSNDPTESDPLKDVSDSKPGAVIMAIYCISLMMMVPVICICDVMCIFECGKREMCASVLFTVVLFAAGLVFHRTNAK
jgi:uncharacterized membrane protein